MSLGIPIFLELFIWPRKKLLCLNGSSPNLTRSNHNFIKVPKISRADFSKAETYIAATM